MKPQKKLLKAAVAGACLSLLAPIAHAEDRALLIGVGDYQSEDISDLPGIDLDVAMMERTAKQLGFQDSQIKILFDEQASYSNIRKHFKTWLTDGVSSSDRVFIYFSGHGTQIPDDNGDEPEGADEALIPYDASVSSSGRPKNFWRDDDMGSMLKSIPSDHVMVFVDACQSGSSNKSFVMSNSYGIDPLGLANTKVSPKFFAYAGMPNASTKGFAGAIEKSSGKRYFYMAAAADDEYAQATSKGSVFTLGVHEYIGEAVSKENGLTARELRNKTDEFIQSHFASQPSLAHEPQLDGHTDMLDKPIYIISSNESSEMESDELEEISSYGDELTIHAEDLKLKVGDSVRFSLDVPENGLYMNIVAIGPTGNTTVLFPNQYQSNNKVSRGEWNFPQDGMNFDIQALPPTGYTEMYVFLTKENINAYEESIDNRDEKGQFNRMFGGLSAKAYRDLGVVARDNQSTSSSEMYVGAVAFEIRQ